MKKKLFSVFMAIVVILSSIAISATAFASSQVLYLNYATSAQTNGMDDLEWFYYTPTQSGMYSLLSYNVPKCEGYLFVKEVDAQTGAKKYVQLAYAPPCSDPNYQENGHNEFQFKLTYHLEAGVTYYYACGWYLSSRTSGSFTVKLVCDSYDDTAIQSIDILDTPTLEAYADGEWRVGPNNENYYHYDINKIVVNSTIRINYSDGTSTTATGKSNIDGYVLSFIDNQYFQHWYLDDDEEYTGNIFTVSIGNKSADTSITLIMGMRYSVSGIVLDLANQPVENATILLGSANMAKTDSNGYFTFYSSAGSKTLSITTDTSIYYSTNIVVATSENDFRDTPFIICNCDVYKDGYINAKDYAKIIKAYSGDRLEALKAEYPIAINADNL